MLRVVETGAGRYVPIRRFELPAETVGTLKAQIELQKQAVRASSAKMDSLNTGHGFYPLPEGTKLLYVYPLCVYIITMMYLLMFL